ncbi:MBL fold metallo-hydrolase [Archaeoglobus neptunius]|uniref:MBL fold metallo-hydrolase n=1 Tax=Archaeoglobus neptunius TaxID=2798580 RepID=UPI001927AB44|nr:MBL fold metallo-hydrolase [Archaeoglobus neptunius]
MVRVYVLVDNKVVDLRPPGMRAEWGFSAYIDAGDPVLMDAGQSDVAFRNMLARNLKIPQKMVISHGHYDHTGGLANILRPKMKIYAHPNAFLPRFYRKMHVGIPYVRERIESVAEVVEHREPVEVAKGVWALGEIPRKYEEALLEDSYIVTGGKKEFDRILDDTAVAVKTDEGILLVLGCCHAGLRNTVEYAEEITGDEVRYIIGGTHLIAFKPDEMSEIIKWLGDKVEKIAPCHCTGLNNEFLLKEKLGDKYMMVGSGSVFEV